MFGLDSLDVIIGIITVYLIFALACTAIVEAISAKLNSRGRNLQKALKEMFHGVQGDDNDFLDKFYAHPKIYSLSQGHSGIPSYITPNLVSLAVEHVLTQGGDRELKDAIGDLPETRTRKTGKTTVEVQSLLKAIYTEAIKKTAAARKLVEQQYGEGDAGLKALSEDIFKQPETIKQKMPDGSESDAPNPKKKMLKDLLAEAESEAASFRELVEQHFEAVMDRAAGWYKRHTQAVAFYVSVVLVIGANVDTFKIVNTLSNSPETRKQMVELAKSKVEELKTASAVLSTQSEQDKEKSMTEAVETLKGATASLNSAGIQLGWGSVCPNLKEDVTEECYNEWKGRVSIKESISKFFGLFISILAVSLGAPFWFDMLNRVMKIRTAGISPREK